MKVRNQPATRSPFGNFRFKPNRQTKKAMEAEIKGED